MGVSRLVSLSLANGLLTIPSLYTNPDSTAGLAVPWVQAVLFSDVVQVRSLRTSKGSNASQVIAYIACLLMICAPSVDATGIYQMVDVGGHRTWYLSISQHEDTVSVIVLRGKVYEGGGGVRSNEVWVAFEDELALFTVTGNHLSGVAFGAVVEGWKVPPEASSDYALSCKRCLASTHGY